MKTYLAVIPNPGGVLSAGVEPGCHSESRRRSFRRDEESLGMQKAITVIQLIRLVHDETSPEILRPAGSE